MNHRRVPTLLSLALLLSFTAACNGVQSTNQESHQACLNEGFDPDTTEFATCVKELDDEKAGAERQGY